MKLVLLLTSALALAATSAFAAPIGTQSKSAKPPLILSIWDVHAECPGSKRDGPPRVAFPGANTQSPKVNLISAAQAPVWKTITIGEYKGVNALRAGIDATSCPIGMGESADEILGRPTFPYGKTRTQLDLVAVSVAELGFGENGASMRDIHARALRLGLELCPAEVGPILRLNYLDQPVGEFLNIAMQPVARYTGELVDFTVGNGGAGLVLIGGDGSPDMVLPGAVRFVFVRPRPDAVSGTELTQEELVDPERGISSHILQN